MKSNGKNLLISMMLLLGMLLCYNIYFQQKNSSSPIELSDENDSSSVITDIDLDLNEEVQIIYELEFFPIVQNFTQHQHFHFTNRFARPFFPVWQPPKLI